MTKRDERYARHDENGVGVPYPLSETMGYMNPDDKPEWPVWVFAPIEGGGLGHGVAYRDGDGFLCRMNDGGDVISIYHDEFEGIFCATEFRADD